MGASSVRLSLEPPRRLANSDSERRETSASWLRVAAGGGIAWALDPAFCEQLLPSFHEDAPTSRYYRFVDCDEIKDAFVRAMSTWAANHDFLNFKDVSSDCAALGVGRACGLAELYIQATASSNGTEAAYVELRSWAYGSVTTAGVVDGFAFSLLAADLFFSRDDCWYMDSSFCSHVSNRWLLSEARQSCVRPAACCRIRAVLTRAVEVRSGNLRTSGSDTAHPASTHLRHTAIPSHPSTDCTSYTYVHTFQ